MVMKKVTWGGNVEDGQVVRVRWAAEGGRLKVSWVAQRGKIGWWGRVRWAGREGQMSNAVG
jgi:hypothetical protein